MIDRRFPSATELAVCFREAETHLLVLSAVDSLHPSSMVNISLLFFSLLSLSYVLLFYMSMYYRSSRD